MKHLGKMMFSLLAIAQVAYGEEEKFQISGDTLFYSTEVQGISKDYISQADIPYFRELLYQNPGVTKINLHSYGGSVNAGLEIARILEDYEIETVVTKECSSACTYIFLSGKKRTLATGAILGFHRPSWDMKSIEAYYNHNKDEYGWSNTFELASWVQNDTFYEAGRIIKALYDSGVELDFILRTMQFEEEQMWYPPRDLLLAFGVLTLDQREALSKIRPRARPILEPGAEQVENVAIRSLQ
jgi:hypothetical protein